MSGQFQSSRHLINAALNSHINIVGAATVRCQRQYMYPTCIVLRRGRIYSYTVSRLAHLFIYLFVQCPEFASVCATSEVVTCSQKAVEHWFPYYADGVTRDATQKTAK